MKNFLFAICFLFTATSFAQHMETSQITGKWSVVKAEPTDATASENTVIMSQLQKGFANAEFEVKEGGDFFASFPPNSPEFVEELSVLNNKNWEWNKSTNTIKIGGESDDFGLMHIVVTPAGDKTFFVIPGLKLEVVRS